jgi:hypothetical protein
MCALNPRLRRVKHRASDPLGNLSCPVLHTLWQGDQGSPAAGGGENPTGKEVGAILILLEATPYQLEPHSPTDMYSTILPPLKNGGRPNRALEDKVRVRCVFTRGRVHPEILLHPLLLQRPHPPRSPGNRALEARRWPNLSGAERSRGPRLIKRHVTH